MKRGEPKQVIVLRNDLRNTQGQKVRTGKLVAQGCHASMKALLDIGSLQRTTTREGGMDKIQVRRTTLSIPLSEEWDVECSSSPDFNHQAAIEWIEGRFTKVVLQADSEDEIKEIYRKAKEAGLLCSLIVDSGLTEFGGVPTITAAAIGPAYPDQFIGITDHLKTL